MSENEHFTRAKSRLHNGTNNEVARAQVEATLALAHEQRTANLIAAYQAEVSGMGRVTGSGPAIDRHNEILDRLGL